MSNSIGHGYVKTDDPNLSKLNKQARSLVAIAADCGWTIRQSSFGAVVLEIGHVGGEMGFQQIVVPTSSTRGPWAISHLRKVLLYGTRNTAKYQAGLAQLPSRGIQLSDLILWTQSHDADAEPVATEPAVLPVEPHSRDWDTDPQPAAVTAEGQGLLDELLPAVVPEPAEITAALDGYLAGEPEPDPLRIPTTIVPPPHGWPEAEPQPEPAAPAARPAPTAEMLRLATQITGLIEDHGASQAARIAELEAELAAERAKRQELEDNLNALGDLIGQIRRT